MAARERILYRVELPDNGKYADLSAGLLQFFYVPVGPRSRDPVRAALSTALKKLNSLYLYGDYALRMGEGDPSIRVVEVRREYRGPDGKWPRRPQRAGLAGKESGLQPYPAGSRALPDGLAGEAGPLESGGEQVQPPKQEWFFGPPIKSDNVDTH